MWCCLNCLNTNPCTKYCQYFYKHNTVHKAVDTVDNWPKVARNRYLVEYILLCLLGYYSCMTNSLKEYPKLGNGQSLSLEERTERLLEIREWLEDGFVSVKQIASRFNVSPSTALDWRNAALILIKKQDNGFTRDAMRNLQIGRIQRQIERLTSQLDKADSKDQLAIHDRIVKYYDSLHRITGLNSEVVQHDVTLKPMSIHIPKAAIEGEATDVPPTSNQDHPSA